MTLGSDHFPRIVYQSPDQALQFIRCLDADCTATTTTPIDSNTANSPGAYGATIILGDDHLPRVVYADCGADNDVHFVRFTGEDTPGVNTDLTIAAGVNINCWPYSEVSMAIGPDHFARITYEDGSTFHLKLIRCTNADCTTPVISDVDANPSHD